MKLLKDGKIFGKINIIDLVIVVVLLILLSTVVIRYMNIKGISNKNSEETVNSDNLVNTEFKYTIKIEYVNEKTGKMFKENDEIYDAIADIKIGKITKVIVQPALSEYINNDGTLEQKEVPTKKDIYLEITTDGNIKNGEYMANGLIRVLAGENKKIKTKYASCLSTVISIEKVEK